ncbi:MAG: SulP family inorganic anion transporter, partial [Methylococcaceae bacterium]|nr:SulP family inorganic anion transporter [Methylococcaceae bacterium]
WDSSLIKQYKWSRLVPAPLLAVIWGVSYKLLTAQYFPAWQIADQHLVSLPVLGSPQAFFQQLSLPDFSQLTNPVVFKIAITLALVASLETLLSVEAVDKLDPLKRITPTNRELKAQGIGNLINGLIGGLPMTAVIVRSSANINAGGQTRISSFLHGIMLLVSVLFFAPLLNQVPLACLASILLLTGYKLAKPDLFSSLYKQGWGQFAPFVITVVAILVTDLLQGIVIGILTGLFFVLKANYQASITLTDHEGTYLLRLHKDVSFLNKALLRRCLMEIPDNCELIIDGQRAHFIDHDILETIADFNQSAKDRNISLEFKGILLVKD